MVYAVDQGHDKLFHTNTSKWRQCVELLGKCGSQFRLLVDWRQLICGHVMISPYTISQMQAEIIQDYIIGDRNKDIYRSGLPSENV
jgi:hypothetical protein